MLPYAADAWYQPDSVRIGYEISVNASYDPEKHCRRSIRLRDYDYSRAGAYFITVCTNGRELLFGEVIDGEVELNELGRIAAEEWLESARIRLEIGLDAWIVMPNHVHGIVIITDDRCRGDRPVAPTAASDANAPRPSCLRPARGPEMTSRWRREAWRRGK